MLLQRLKEYNDKLNKLEPVPPMYQKKTVPWLIELDLKGNLLRFRSTIGWDKKDKGKEFIVPHPGARTSNIKPGLLVDKAEYVLGIYKDKNTKHRHRSFVEIVGDCAKATGEKAVAAVYKFLVSQGQGYLPILLPKEIKTNTIVAFTVNGRMPTDLPSVQKFWSQKNINLSSDNHARSKQCIICGDHCTPVSPHPISIKPVPGGQSSGLAIVSANKSAYESYGLENSLIAPTCRDCAEAYAKGANELLRKDKNTSLVVGPLVYIFWTKENLDLPLLSLLSQHKPAPGQVKKLLATTSACRHYDAADEKYFYAAALSASNARVVVRDWLQTTVGTVRQNMSHWFQMQRLVTENGEEAEPIGVYPLAAALYRYGDATRQMTPNVPKAIIEVALKGGPLPDWLLYQAVKRNKAEQKVTRTRLVLIKMVILSKYQVQKEDCLVELDRNNVNPAYLCGRLLAELENIQRAAIKPNITFVERFYSTASSSPAAVFGTLLRLAQAHLAKLRKQKPGLYVAQQHRLEGIQSKLKAFPRILKLEEQGLFALGYYHQRAFTRNQNPKLNDKFVS